VNGGRHLVQFQLHLQGSLKGGLLGGMRDVSNGAIGCKKTCLLEKMLPRQLAILQRPNMQVCGLMMGMGKR